MRTSQPLPIVLVLSGLIDGLFEAVAARFGKFPFHGPLHLHIWRVFDRVKHRFAKLATRVAAGRKLSRPRPAGPEGARAPQPRPASGRRPRPPRNTDAFHLKTWVTPNFGWLCRVMKSTPGESDFAGALTRLLADDPDMRTLLAATPRAGRILKPLCFMLGVNLALLHPARAHSVAPTASSVHDAVAGTETDVATVADRDRYNFGSPPEMAAAIPGRYVGPSPRFAPSG